MKIWRLFMNFSNARKRASYAGNFSKWLTISMVCFLLMGFVTIVTIVTMFFRASAEE